MAAKNAWIGSKDITPFIFVYRTDDRIALSGSLDSAEIYISCSVNKCERHSITKILISIYHICLRMIGCQLFSFSNTNQLASVNVINKTLFK